MSDAQLSLNEMILRWLDGSLSPDDLARLNQRLAEDDSAVQCYVDLVLDDLVLSGLCDMAATSPEGLPLESPQQESPDRTVSEEKTAPIPINARTPTPDQAKVEEIKRFAQAQLDAFLREQEDQDMSYQPYVNRSWDWRTFFDNVVRYTRWCVRAAKVTAVLSVTLLVCLIVVLGVIRKHMPVATVIEVRDARWEQEDFAPEVGTRLKPTSFYLQEGLVHIEFDAGTRSILQAPCRLRLVDDNQLRLESGQVTSLVPESAYGFIVDTPASQVTDLGTEFGVLVNREGRSEVHVFEGHIQLHSPSHEEESSLQDLTAGQTARATADGSIEVGHIEDQSHLFIREMPAGEGLGVPGKELSLADIVGGGNGYGSGVANSLIDPLTGQWIGAATVNMPARGADMPGSGRFVAVPQMPFVDGVFVPDGDQGPVVISSQNHIFESCPNTTGSFMTGINNAKHVRHPDNSLQPVVVNNSPSETGRYPIFSVPANQGITFDLESMRLFFSGLTPYRFKTRFALARIYNRDGSYRYGGGQVWVLLDGRPVFNFELLGSSDWNNIDIPIGRENRFLTLISLDGAASSGDPDDWFVFAEARLDLGPVTTDPNTAPL